MGRGYSATRSRSGRPTVRRKRERSMSLVALRNSLKDGSSTPANSAKSSVESVAQVSTKRNRSSSVLRVKKTPSASPRKEEDSTEKRRSRSVSLLSEKVRLLAKELEEQIEPSEDDEETLIKQDVMTKYKFIGHAVDEVLDYVSKACVVGANSKVLCDQGDKKMEELIQPLFSKAKNENGQKIVRGLSFPTTVSVNEVICNHSPYNDEDGKLLRLHDVVKIHVGCHLDGYPVSAARTVVVKEALVEEPLVNEEEESRKNLSSSIPEGTQHTIHAAQVALLGMIHSLRPSTLNVDITDFVARVGHHFSSQALEGVLSNRVKRWVPDGMDCIIGRRVVHRVPQQDVGECEIKENQVWTLDIAFTNSPTSRTFMSPEVNTVFRRTPEDFPNDPRVKNAAVVLKEISEKFFCFPFHSKHLSNPLASRFGIRALVQKGVIEELPVLRVKPPYISARFSATVAITSKRIVVLCGLPSDYPLISSLPEDIQEVICTPLDFATAAAQRREHELNFSSVRKKAKSEK